MFKKVKNKCLAGLAAVTCVFGASGVMAQIGFTIANVDAAESGGSSTSLRMTGGVEGEGAYSIEIVSKNLSYADSVYILYAVSWSGFDESQNEVKMLFWNESQTEYTEETAENVKRAEYTTTLGEKECIVFYSDGIAAKGMADTIYCCAYTEIDGKVYYSEAEKFGVLDYVYTMQAERELTEAQTAVFADMLDYGASAQKLFGYNTDRLANATYYTVTVENGVLEDGFAWGRYALNATDTLTANAPADGYAFVGWVDETGATVAETETVSVSVTANKTYTAVYSKIPQEPEVEATPASAFEYTSDGESVTITKYVGDYADVVIPSTIDGLPVTGIGAKAFYNCSRLTSVAIGDSVANIARGVFNGCSSLEEMTIPFIGGSRKTSSDTYQYPFGYIFGGGSYEGGEEIEQSYYGETTSYTTYSVYYIPTSLKKVKVLGGEILRGAFDSCSSLTSVVISENVTSICDWAFSGCSGLMSVEIPNSVTSIGSYAFYYCKGLTNIKIPSGVAKIGNLAFSSCNSLTNITVAKDNIAYQDIDGNLYTKDGSTLVRYAIGKIEEEFIIPNGVTSIGSSAFEGCVTLKSVKIGDDVLNVGYRSFYGCTNLTNVIIGDGATSIQDSAFEGCRKLTSVIIGAAVTHIGYYAFYGCSSLTSVTFKNPNGWWRASSSTATSGTAVDSMALSDTATAAEYLRSKYYYFYWNRSE